MKSIVLQGGIPTFISSSEHHFLDENFTHAATVYKRELTEREAEIARILTSRGILQRFSDNTNGIYFKLNTTTGTL